MNFKELLQKLVDYINQILDFLKKLAAPEADEEAPAEPEAPVEG